MLALAAAIAALGPFALNGTAAAAEQAAREKLVIESDGKTHTFDIEVARAPHEKARGLMYRTELKPLTGMLFPYEAAEEVQMWMRNTYIPLDMLFIRADGRIHRIAARTEPMSDKIIGSNGPVTAVLEIGGGEAARLGIKAGDVVKHGHFKGE